MEDQQKESLLAAKIRDINIVVNNIETVSNKLNSKLNPILLPDDPAEQATTIESVDVPLLHDLNDIHNKLYYSYLCLENIYGKLIV